MTDIQHEEAATYDRQIRAFGEEGQAALARLRLGVVGLGGTGSVVVQQLAHLGVSDFLLVDPDAVETTNLNRTVGSTPKSVGESKVSVAARMIRSIRPDARVEEIVETWLTRAPLSASPNATSSSAARIRTPAGMSSINSPTSTESPPSTWESSSTRPDPR